MLSTIHIYKRLFSEIYTTIRLSLERTYISLNMYIVILIYINSISTLWKYFLFRSAFYDYHWDCFIIMHRISFFMAIINFKIKYLTSCDSWRKPIKNIGARDGFIFGFKRMLICRKAWINRTIEIVQKLI